ncbi:MAG: sodium:proton exchanger [Rhodospirillaceae bacterium]|nr:sodium:proton exchanger [Rhodospirillaceae bacterium]
MEAVDWALLIGAGSVLALAVTSGYVKNRLWISEPTICLLIGIAVGPVGIGFADIRLGDPGQNLFIEQAARITVAISVMGAALRLPLGYVRCRWRELAVVLLPGMLLMWAVSGAIVWGVFGLPLLVALLIGAVVTPTDPVLADSIVAGTVAEASVPERMRHALTVESGANDGLGLMFVLLPISLLDRPTGEALTHWIGFTVGWELLSAIAIGAAMGWLSGKAADLAFRRPDTEATSITTVGLALTLTALAAVSLVESDGILAVFVAGLVFNQTAGTHAEVRHEHFQESVGRFFDLPIFILFGMILPWREWGDLGWPAAVAVVGILALRRLPAWFLIARWLPSLRTKQEVLFNGWFGPIGIAALFYATMAYERTGESTVWTVATLIIFSSIMVHGITATPLTRLFAHHAAEAATRESRSPEDPA